MGRVDVEEVGGVGVEGEQVCPRDAALHQAVDGVRAAAAATEDLDVDPEGLKDLLQLRVVRGLVRVPRNVGGLLELLLRFCSL